MMRLKDRPVPLIDCIRTLIFINKENVKSESPFLEPIVLFAHVEIVTTSVHRSPVGGGG